MCTAEPNSKISVLVVEPEKIPYAAEISPDLASLQKAVGGYIQAVYPYEEPVALIVNEDGKLEGLPLNRALREEDGTLYDVVAGTMLVTGIGEEDFCSLTEEQMERFAARFRTPEMFISLNGRLVALPLEVPPEMSGHPPVYRYSAVYAAENGQLDAYRASHKWNIACSLAIEEAIRNHYADNRLDAKAAEEIIHRFGADRVEYVLANTVQQMDWDGRFSRETKDWAGSTIISENRDFYGQDRNTAFRIARTHPGLINLFIEQFRKLQKDLSAERPSVMQQLRQAAPVQKVPSKKHREPER